MNKEKRLVIVDGVRTPFCKMGSDLARLNAADLGKAAVQSLLTKTGLDPEEVDEVIFGCVGQPVDSANVARVIALQAGIPRSKPAMTVHRNCASGLEALTSAYEKMLGGQGEVFIIGGAESMSTIPLLYSQRAAEKFAAISRAKSLGGRLSAMLAFRPKDFSPLIGLKLGLTDPVCGLNMGETAEVLAREFHISREEQDSFAVESHRKAEAARERLKAEISPVFLNGNRNGFIREDNGVRPGQSMEALKKLRPVFDRKTGTVTPGNASQITDGAVALLVMSEEKATALGLQPLGYLRGYRYAGCDPERMGLGPVYAIARAKETLGLRLEDADLIEFNEAFAVQVLSVIKALESDAFAKKCLGADQRIGEMPRERLNVNGGAIALGHPVGATGARLVLTALKELQRRNAKRALLSLCVGGGQGAAVWVERI